MYENNLLVESHHAAHRMQEQRRIINELDRFKTCISHLQCSLSAEGRHVVRNCSHESAELLADVA